LFDFVKSDVKNTSDIANELCLDYELTYRLLRAIGSLGILKEEVNSEDGSSRFSLTPQGRLIKDNPQYVTLEDLSRKAARDKSTVHRSLQKLVNERIVHKETRTQKERGYYHIYCSVDHQSLKTETENRVSEMVKNCSRLLSSFKVDLEKLD